MKIQDIITENQAGVRKGRLNELAPGGSEGNGPFDYGPAIIQIGQDFAEFYDDDGSSADAQAIIKVGNTFMDAGMAAGIRAFYAMDTQVRDHVAEQLEDQGFNVRQDIYEPHDKSLPATTWTRPVQPSDRDWYLLQDLIKEFSKIRQRSVDPKTLEQLRRDFGWSLQKGFLELPKKSIRADFTDFAKSKGVDLTAMAKKYEVRRPADRDTKNRDVSEDQVKGKPFQKTMVRPDEAYQRLAGREPKAFAIDVLMPDQSAVKRLQAAIGNQAKIRGDDSIAGDGMGIQIVTPVFPDGRTAQQAFKMIMDLIRTHGGEFNRSTGAIIATPASHDMAEGRRR